MSSQPRYGGSGWRPAPVRQLPAIEEAARMDLLSALRRRLATAAQGERSAAGDLTISDLYQRLIPYRAIRLELGVLALAEYEHALLRLLGGEGRCVEVIDVDVLAEIQRELASSSPILGIYRDYPTAPVRLHGEGATGRGAHVDELAVAPMPVPQPPSPPARAHIPADPPASPRPAPSPPAPRSPPVPARDRVAPRCGDCRRDLPLLPDVRFCPFCGRPSAPPPCAQCGIPLEGEWSFCIACGTPRSATRRARD